jgi:D-sedoheptulose 7-phosphate isomerase
MIRQHLETIFRGHEEAFSKTFRDKNLEVLEAIAREILKALKAGKKILLCGNGGSAADSQHIAAEYIVRFKINRMSLPAIALSTDTSTITATANDYDFSEIFSRQVAALGQEGDILLAISTSGKSPNILKAVHEAKLKKMVVVGLTGAAGGELAKVADICLKIESSNTPHIQEMHITALHAIAEVTEHVLFG